MAASRFIVILATAAIVGSCAPKSTAPPVGQSTPNTSPSAQARPSPSPSPVAVTSSYGVLITFGNPTYTVSLVNVDGKVVASAQATIPTQVTCGANGNPAYVPYPVSTSNSRAYFVDAQGVVHFLAPTGETGRATTVPAGSSSRRSMFAVSPDDQRIAVVVDDFNSNGASTKLYVEDLNGGGNRVDPYSQSGANTLWPVGWHGTNNLVVAKVPACVQGGSTFAVAIPYELHVVDPTTAVRRFTIGGGSDCTITGPPSQAGAVCENLNPQQWKGTVLSWTASPIRTFATGGAYGAYISPQGKTVALVTVASDSTTFDDGHPPLAFRTCGWIDDTHLLSSGDAQRQPRVVDVTNSATVVVAAEGFCAGRLPGGL